MDQINKDIKNDIKIIVVGNSGTGKTSFVNKWIKDTFDESYKATIVSEFSYQIVDYNALYHKVTNHYNICNEFHLLNEKCIQ